MKQLIIIGAGNFGREVFSWATQCREFNIDWTIKGFLDDRKNILEGFYSYGEILGTVEGYIPEKDDLFICALGEPISKKKYAEIILNKKGVFTNLIHPSTIFGLNIKIGNGVIVCPGVIISSDVLLGDYVTINSHSLIGHDCIIDNWCQINSNCCINGNNHLFESVFMGGGSVTLPNVVVDEFAVIGAGSVVLKKINANETVFGNPAKSVKFPQKENKAEFENL